LDGGGCILRAIKDNFNRSKNDLKRGEKEAISLVRRRRLRTALNIFSVTTICLVIISSLYLWRNGTFTSWTNEGKDRIGKLLVDAGLVVETIDVIGEQVAFEQSILAASEINIGDALLSLDIGATVERIEQLPWIKEAAIRRDFSGDVVINVREHKPAALWQVDNKLWVVSDEGVQITDQQLEYFANLPMISGIGAEKQLEALIDAISSNEDLFESVETATWVGGRRWDIILKNGIKIMMPETELAQAWQNLSELEQSEQLLARNILAVDFRVKDKTVVRLTPEEANRRRLLAKTSGKGEEI
jgi:cell division protein FtsQ